MRLFITRMVKGMATDMGTWNCGVPGNHLDRGFRIKVKFAKEILNRYK
jgi:hypothetical protein